MAISFVPFKKLSFWSIYYLFNVSLWICFYKLGGSLSGSYEVLFYHWWLPIGLPKSTCSRLTVRIERIHLSWICIHDIRKRVLSFLVLSKAFMGSFFNLTISRRYIDSILYLCTFVALSAIFKIGICCWIFFLFFIKKLLFSLFGRLGDIFLLYYVRMRLFKIKTAVLRRCSLWKVFNNRFELLLLSTELFLLLFKNYFVFCLTLFYHKVEFLLQHFYLLFDGVFDACSFLVKFLIEFEYFLVKLLILLMNILKLKLLFLNKELFFI